MAERTPCLNGNVAVHHAVLDMIQPLQVLKLTHNLPTLSTSVFHLQGLKHLRSLHLGVPPLDFVMYDQLVWNHEWPPARGGIAALNQGFSRLSTLHVCSAP